MAMPHWTALVTLAALAMFFWMMFRVGKARGHTGIQAPATTGHPDFERAFRIHMNTLEWMPLFLPALWLSALYVGDRFAAVCGLVWIAGRVFYALSYAADPAKRGSGFSIQAAAAGVLWIAALAGIVRAIAGA